MKTILITGVDSGIGKATALKFLSEGDFVIGTSLAEQVDYSHENLKVFHMNLLLEEDINNCISQIKDLGKKIDIFINNAGIMVDTDEEKVVIEKLRKTLEVNLIGTIDFTEKLLSEINEGGHIINISSSAGSLAKTGVSSHKMGYYPGYKISKAALNMYTRTLALRLKDKIIVSSIHPGWVKTEMGGQEANLTSEQSAEDIFDFAITEPETGQFWFKGEKFDW